MSAARYISAIVVGLAIVLLVAYGLYTQKAGTNFSEAATIGKNAQDFQELTARFKTLADTMGAEYAFEVLRRADLPPNTDLHLLGHTVGDELYKQEGISGIASCTQDFRNACSHAVVIGALNEFGPVDTTLKKIDDACKLAPGGLGAYTMCYHGLGHGVFAYFGYDIPKTVSFCKRMGTAEYHDEQFAQCVGGAIMELVGGGGHDHQAWLVAQRKYLTVSDPLSPCDTSLIPDSAKSFCVVYITPQLFKSAGAELANPDPATFPEAFRFCDDLSNGRLRDTCYRSFGKEFVTLAASRDIRTIDQMDDDEYLLAMKWCGFANNTRANSGCVREELQSIFWGGENDPQASFRFCALAAGEVSDACYDELAHAIPRYIPQKEALCQKLPQKFQTDCMEGTLISS